MTAMLGVVSISAQDSIPLAAGVLYNYGFVLSPAIGAVFISLSTIIVAINAQLLKKQI